MAYEAMDPGTGQYVDVPEVQSIEEFAGPPEDEKDLSKKQRRHGITRAKVIVTAMFLVLLATIAYFIDKGLKTVNEMWDRHSSPAALQINRNGFGNAEPVLPDHRPVVSDYNIIPVAPVTRKPYPTP